MRRTYHLKSFFTASLLLTDAFGLILAFEAAYWTRFHFDPFLLHFPVTKGIPAIQLYHQALAVLLPVWLLVFGYLGFYQDRHSPSAYDELILVLKGLFLSALLTTAMTFAYRGAEYSRLVIGLWSLYSTTLIFLFRTISKTFFSKLFFWLAGPKHVLVIGKGNAVDAIRAASKHQPLLRVHFMENAPDHPMLESWVQTRHLSEVVLVQGGLSNETILATAKLCDSLLLECQVVPDLFEMRRGQVIMDGFVGLPTFHIKPLSLHGTNFYLKRTFDILCSLLVLAFLFIPTVLIALLIRLDSSGPILFIQNRMGLHGQKFKCFKFRTMVADADAQIDNLKHLSDRTGPVFKMKNDPRITPVGKWLRALSIDEFPQIINVLRGDMSLVGPRPQVLWEAAAYDDHAKKRLRILPGITGLWQVSGRASLSYEEMIDLDVYYLENWSLGLDLRILLRTLPAVFAKEGAY